MRQEQTCYEVLGVSKDATDRELKSAYRRLSKSLHPDVSPLPDADERFQEAKEAYDILKDEEKRTAYDKRLAALAEGRPWDDGAFAHFDAAFERFYRRPASGRKPINGENIHVKFYYTTEQVLRNEPVTTQVEHRDRCATCSSTGKVPAKGKATCATCSGKGFRLETVRDPINGSYTNSVPCKDCQGSGTQLDVDCPDCHGEKRKLTQKDITFSIPQHVKSGTILRVKGAGGKGLHDGDDGDVLITVVRSPKDPAYVLDNGDILYHLVLPPEHLLTKKRINIQLPDGTQREFELTSNRPGAQIVVPEAGLGRPDKTRGSIIYLVYPGLPKESGR